MYSQHSATHPGTPACSPSPLFRLKVEYVSKANVKRIKLEAEQAEVDRTEKMKDRTMLVQFRSEVHGSSLDPCPLLPLLPLLSHFKRLQFELIG